MIEVVAKDIRFPQDTYRAQAGTVHVTDRNEGSITHTLVIEDVDGFRLKVRTHGDVTTGAVDLAAGKYTLYCDVAGHRQAGMHAELEVA